MHYGLYAVLLLMLSVLLNVASPVSLSPLTGLDTSRLHSEGFDRLVADAQRLREQAGSSDLLLWILVGIFVVEAHPRIFMHSCAPKICWGLADSN